MEQKTSKTNTFTAEDIEHRFEECVMVFQNSPNEVRVGMKTFWPDILHTPEEIARHEKKKITKITPLPQSIDRAHECLTWIAWVEERERDLIWLRAECLSWRMIARLTGIPVASARRYWNTALSDIAQKLNQQSDCRVLAVSKSKSR